MGIPITTNHRVYPDLPMPDYLGMKGYASSHIAYASESLRKLEYALTVGIRSESRALDFGSMLHLKVESNTKFYQQYEVRPDGLDKRTKAGKEWFAELEQSGKIIVDRADWEKVHAMADEYEHHPDELIRICRESEGEAETSVFWTEQGLEMKCRPDRLIRPSQADCEMLCERFPSLFKVPFGITINVDFKTTSRPLDPKSVYWTCVNFNYFLKASHYIAGTKADAFLFVMLETNPPYEVTRYFVSPQRMLDCQERRQEIITRIAECESTGEWPGLVISDEDTLI